MMGYIITLEAEEEGSTDEKNRHELGTEKEV